MRQLQNCCRCATGCVCLCVCMPVCVSTGICVISKTSTKDDSQGRCNCGCHVTNTDCSSAAAAAVIDCGINRQHRMKKEPRTDYHGNTLYEVHHSVFYYIYMRIFLLFLQQDLRNQSKRRQLRSQWQKIRERGNYKERGKRSLFALVSVQQQQCGVGGGSKKCPKSKLILNIFA